jgi:ankyrin repeat protein
MLDEGVDVNWQSSDTKTCGLHVAAKHGTKVGGADCQTADNCQKKGHMDVCDVLLERGANVNCQNRFGWTPMHFAVSSGFLEMVELLRSYGAFSDVLNRQQQSPIDLARQHGYSRIEDVLRGRPPRSATMVKQDQLKMQKKSVDVVVPEAAGSVVVSTGSAKSAEKQLSKAMAAGDLAGVIAALDAGADVNHVNPTTSICPIHVAVKQGKLDIARVLLERGADVNTQTKAGWTPMHFAVNKSSIEMAELLRDFGGKSDTLNEWLKSPTDIARDKKDEAMLLVLRRKGNARSAERRTDEPAAASASVSPRPSAEPVESTAVAAAPIVAENAPVTESPPSPEESAPKEVVAVAPQEPVVVAVPKGNDNNAHPSGATSPRGIKSPRVSIFTKKPKEVGPLKRDDEQARLIEEAMRKKKLEQKQAKPPTSKKPGFFVKLRGKKSSNNTADNRKSLPVDSNQLVAPSATNQPQLDSPEGIESRPDAPLKESPKKEAEVVAAPVVAAAPVLLVEEANKDGESGESQDSSAEEKKDATPAANAGELTSGTTSTTGSTSSSEKPKLDKRSSSFESLSALRGACAAPGCNCSKFSVAKDSSNSMCDGCGHFPSQVGLPLSFLLLKVIFFFFCFSIKRPVLLQVLVFRLRHLRLRLLLSVLANRRSLRADLFLEF